MTSSPEQELIEECNGYIHKLQELRGKINDRKECVLRLVKNGLEAAHDGHAEIVIERLEEIIKLIETL